VRDHVETLELMEATVTGRGRTLLTLLAAQPGEGLLLRVLACAHGVFKDSIRMRTQLDRIRQKIRDALDVVDLQEEEESEDDSEGEKLPWWLTSSETDSSSDSSSDFSSDSEWEALIEAVLVDEEARLRGGGSGDEEEDEEEERADWEEGDEEQEQEDEEEPQDKEEQYEDEEEEEQPDQQEEEQQEVIQTIPIADKHPRHPDSLPPVDRPPAASTFPASLRRASIARMPTPRSYPLFSLLHLPPYFLILNAGSSMY
jgi:hypothetical protein